MENNYEVAFQLILHAGNGKSYAMESIKLARKYQFEEALLNVAEAESEMTKAHHVQTKLIQQEASGEKFQLDLIMVHAQDHLSSCMMYIDQAKEYIYIYKELQNLRGGK